MDNFNLNIINLEFCLFKMNNKKIKKYLFEKKENIIFTLPH